jgi:filamin
MAGQIKVVGTGLNSGFAEAPNKFTINSQGLNVSKLALAFDGPSKPECKMTTQKDGSVDVVYTTALAGEYKIHVKFDDEHVPGSPFAVKILGDVKANVQKVKVSGPAIKTGKVNAVNDIVVDAREAGITSGLQVSMEGPSKPEISFKNDPDGTTKVQYKPSTAGAYKLNLKFNNIPLPGSPFNIKVA